MRPAGEVRQALSKAAEALAAECGGATWRDMAARAQVGFTVARRTVENMDRAGALQRVGMAKREHSKRRMTLYAPATSAAAPQSAQGWSAQAGSLDLALRGWMRR